MNYITTIGTHNSYSNLDSGFSDLDEQNQILSITDQLQLGARYLRLDEQYYQGQMRLCHVADGACSGSTSISPGRLFANGVREIANWLAQNPSEFIVLDLNGDPQGESVLVMEPILTYIGESKIVTTGDANCLLGGTCVFPSLKTVRTQGKQVLILSAHFQDPTFTFPRTLLDEKDPFNPNSGVTQPAFASCQDNSGNLMRNHGSDAWPYTSEDRSGNALFLNPPAFLGFLDEAEVQQAASCAYAIIAIDYLNSRSHTYPEDDNVYQDMPLNKFPPEVTTDTPDNRFASAIWSFDVGDSGANVYAFMQTNGRWSTAPASTSMNYACSDGPLNSFAPNPQWVVVANAYGAFQNGENACLAEGSVLGLNLHFAHPVNGAQNLDLANVANGLTTWVNYQVQTVPNFAVAPIAMASAMGQGGAAPAGQQILVGGPPNVSVTISAIAVGSNTGLSWLQLPSSPSFTLDANGTATVNLGFTSAVTGLPAGLYQASVVFTIAGGAISSVTTSSVTVALTVEITPTINLTCGGNSAEEGVGLPCSVTISASNGSAGFPGLVSLQQIATDSSGRTVVNTLQSLAVEPIVDIAVFPAVYSAALPIGNSTLIATYSGDSTHPAAASGTWNVVVLPFLAAQPTSETTSFPVGQPLSAQPLTSIVYTNVTQTFLTVSCTTSPCWMQGIPGVNSNPKLNGCGSFSFKAKARSVNRMAGV